LSIEARGVDVLLIGASRGLGLAIAREYLTRGATVVATVRGTKPTALHDLVDEFGGRLTIETVDVTDVDALTALRETQSGRTFDLLFVNAGVTNAEDETPLDVGTDEFIRVMVTNALSPMRAIELPGGLVREDGTIAVMSSGQGSISNNERGGFEIYRTSKSALNQLMRSYAARTRDEARTLLLMAPGWVQTELGGPRARLTIDENIPKLVNTIGAQHGYGGLQFLDYPGETIAW
jgi:NAD(P)-dependent dehydrogenase (short-subunit alcohol dehydrogenase family)